MLTGGGGTDTASYSESSAGVTVDLAAGTGTGGDAQGDALTTIENVIGSDHDDTLTGDANDNRLDGGAGDDTIHGGDGNDIFVFGGGDGADTFHGGAGWADDIRLEDVSGGPNAGKGWVLTVDGGGTYTEGANSLTFDSADASGTITLDDGSEVTFDGVETVSW